MSDIPQWRAAEQEIECDNCNKLFREPLYVIEEPKPLIEDAVLLVTKWLCYKCFINYTSPPELIAVILPAP